MGSDETGSLDDSRPIDSERACIDLWSAVLDLGIRDARKAMKALCEPKPENPTDSYIFHLRNRRWLFSKENTPGSFVWICQQLDLNPRVVREEVLWGKRLKPIKPIARAAKKYAEALS